jgi:hypothetical protein
MRIPLARSAAVSSLPSRNETRNIEIFGQGEVGMKAQKPYGGVVFNIAAFGTVCKSRSGDHCKRFE